jgi:hypothetical protein
VARVRLHAEFEDSLCRNGCGQSLDSKASSRQVEPSLWKYGFAECEKGSRFIGCLGRNWVECQLPNNSRLPGGTEFASNLEGYSVGLGTIDGHNDESTGSI